MNVTNGKSVRQNEQTLKVFRKIYEREKKFVFLGKFRFVCIVDKLLPLLLSCLNKDSGKVQTIAASALLGLVFNNQKVNPPRMLFNSGTN